MLGKQEPNYKPIRYVYSRVDNMKALIRGEEIITEPFNQWIEEHLDWLSTARPDGDGYELVEDYQPPEISEETP